MNPFGKYLKVLRRALVRRKISERSVVLGGVALLVLLMFLAVYYSTQRSALERLRNVADFNMASLSHALDAALERHEYLPELLSRNAAIKSFLENPSLDSRDAMGLYLRELNNISRTLDIYLMNEGGVTVASSNFDKSYSFVGKNFNFRPYFKQAFTNGTGRYFALGTNSGERGYYFSAGVQNDASEIIGVVVVKMSVGPLETEWKSDEAGFMVTDQLGIVFMASHSDWRLKALYPLSEDTRREIQASRRYPRQSLEELNDFSVSPLDERFSIARLGGERYLLSRVEQSHGWEIYLLANWGPIDRSVTLALGLAALLMGLTSLLLFLLWKNQQQRRLYEQQAREELEIKVEERTQQLRLTQEELVQAAKMAALGQLSAAINHEINNPLSAIRAYADNAHQFLERGRTDMAVSNLQEITGLTERMATITRQLKTFSRKSQGQIERCNLDKALDSALLIVHPKLSQTQVVLHQQRDVNAEWVKADLVWLEQILVNLLSNAVEAVSERNHGQVWLSSHAQDGRVVVQVSDNGEGITDEDMPHVFEAFFTTKSIGKGLGLGLSISYRLAKDMQGDLMVARAKQGGAEFTLELGLDEGESVSKGGGI